jgi:hypothetical protein
MDNKEPENKDNINQVENQPKKVDPKNMSLLILVKL